MQSEPLKKFLTGVLEGYPGITATLNHQTFIKPFRAFVHRWERFAEARLSQELDATTKAHVDLLYELLEGELGPVIAHKNDLVQNGVMTHELLYTIFEPGDAIFGVVDRRQRAFVFKEYSIDSRTQSFQITSTYVDFDGHQIGFTAHPFSIPAYEGTIPITSLPVFPLKYHSDQATIRKDLIVRGLIWENYKGYHYKQYQGTAVGYRGEKRSKVNVKGRIVIDTEAYNTFNPDVALSFSSTSLPAPNGMMANVYGNVGIILPRSIRQYFSDSRVPRSARLDEAVSFSSQVSDTLSDDQRLVSTPILRGYSLNSKRWLEFYVDGVKDIVWNSGAFDSLVLPPAQQNLKKLILGFTNARSKQLGGFDDVVEGKGRGIITLLSGPPGVGKTLTAESVADTLKVPLYVLSAGDLGTNAVKVEEKLSDILEIVPKWGAILLLDEADVFMETRNTADLARNELVSIFLRLLEYYEVCILVLFHVRNKVLKLIILIFRASFSSRLTASKISIPLSSPAFTSLSDFLNLTRRLDARYGPSS